jgi:hypothetical protein
MASKDKKPETRAGVTVSKEEAKRIDSLAKTLRGGLGMGFEAQGLSGGEVFDLGADGAEDAATGAVIQDRKSTGMRYRPLAPAVEAEPPSMTPTREVNPSRAVFDVNLTADTQMRSGPSLGW